MPNQAIYARLSKDKTGAGLAIERQVAEVIAHFGLPAATPVYPDNDLSASTGIVRPSYRRLLDAITSGTVKQVYVWHTDRLWRLPRDLEDFLDAADSFGVSTYGKQAGVMDLSTPAGRVAARIGVSIAKYEVEIKGERQRARNLQAAKAGLPHVTHRPFGYERDGVTFRPDEIDTLRLIAKLTLCGYSYQEVAYQLNERGCTTTGGKRFHNLTVRKLLTNKRYAGIRSYLGQDYPGTWPAVFDEDEWSQLQLIVRIRRETANRPQVTPRKFLLTGLIVCGRCGHFMSGMSAKHSRDGVLRRNYRCQKQGRTERTEGCTISRNADALDEFVRQLIVFRLDSPALGRLLSKEGTSTNHLTDLLDQRRVKVDRKAALTDDYADSTLTKDEYSRAKQRIDLALEAIDRELTEVQRDHAMIELRPGQRVDEAWQANGLGWRRQLVELLIEKILVMPTNASAIKKANYFEGYRFNPADVRVVWRA